MRPRWCLGIALVLAACVPAPEDTLSHGTLCNPETPDCPASTTLRRDSIGRNQVDYVIRNNGATPVTAEMLALVPGIDFGEVDIAPEDLIARRTHELITAEKPGEGRFTPVDLGARDSFQFGVRCSGCDVAVDFVHASIPRECFEDNDCPSSWQCDTVAARCAECLNNNDCAADQRCNVNTGRCDPPDISRGCSTAPASPFAVVLLGLLVLVVGRRRRVGAVIFSAALLLPFSADAAPPRASIAVAGGARVMTGKLGPLTKRGVGLAIQQELRWRYIGAAMSLSTAYFLTKQEPPPFSRSLHTYSVAIGPRGYLPLSPFELVIGADYRRLGTVSNSLIRVTGERRSFDAVGGTVGGRLRWSGLDVRLDVSAHRLLQIDTNVIGVDLGFGFTNTQ